MNSKSKIFKNYVWIGLSALFGFSATSLVIETLADSTRQQNCVPYVIFALLFWTLCARKIILLVQYKLLVRAISQDVSSIDQLSREMKTSPNKARKRILFFIDKGWLLNARYNDALDKVELTNRVPSPSEIPCEHFDSPPPPVMPDPFEYSHTAPEPSFDEKSETAAGVDSGAKVFTGEKVIVYCKACGAQNVTTQGEISECEYCGSKIKG